MRNQTLFVIRGIPGSGKSTLARQISERFGISMFEADDFFITPQGFYEFNPERIVAAHTDCRWRVFSELEAGRSAIVSNTFTREWEMQEYLRKARNNFIPAIVITCTGQYENVHNVPEDKVAQMSKRFEDIQSNSLKMETFTDEEFRNSRFMNQNTPSDWFTCP